MEATDGKSKMLYKLNTDQVLICFRDEIDNSTCLGNHSFMFKVDLLKSPYFKAILSKSCPSFSMKEQQNEKIIVILLHGLESYNKCLRFLRSSDKFELSSVTEALQLLPVALEWQMDDCIQHCLKYLEVSQWKDMEEAHTIRNTVNGLHLEPSAILSLRIHAFTMDVPSKTLQKLLEDFASVCDCHANPDDMKAKNALVDFLAAENFVNAARSQIAAAIRESFETHLKWASDISNTILLDKGWLGMNWLIMQACRFDGIHGIFSMASTELSDNDNGVPSIEEVKPQDEFGSNDDISFSMSESEFVEDAVSSYLLDFADTVTKILVETFANHDGQLIPPVEIESPGAEASTEYKCHGVGAFIKIHRALAILMKAGKVHNEAYVVLQNSSLPKALKMLKHQPNGLKKIQDIMSTF